MPASRTTPTKVARLETRRSLRQAKPSKTVSSTTSPPSARKPASPNTITPPKSITPVPHSAPSRTVLLPDYYVAPRPRNAYLIFRGQVYLHLKDSHKDPGDIWSEASRLWNTLSKEERRPYHELASEEKALHKKRFPDYVYGQYVKVKFEVEWSAEKDGMFVIDEEGVLQLAPPPPPEEDVVVHSAAAEVAPTPAEASSTSGDDKPDAEEHARLYFPWEIEQNMGVYDAPMPFNPYPLLPPAAGVFHSGGDIVPQQFPLVDPVQSGQDFFNLHYAPMHYPFQAPPFQPGGMLELLFSD